MKKTEVTHLHNNKNQLVGIKVKTDLETFTVPVLDVRRSEDERQIVEKFIKAERSHSGSKFFKPSYSLLGYSYNISKK
jgi:hypothetical protein